MAGDTAVNHRDADSRAVPAGLPGDVCVYRGCGLVERAAQSAVGRNVGHIGIVRKCVQRFHGHGVMRAFNDVQFGLQNTALVLHLLMVGIGRCLIELDDHVYRGAV